MESAAGRSLGRKHGPTFEILEEFEPALDGFTIPLVQNFADTRAKQRLFDVNSARIGGCGGFAQSGAQRMSSAESIAVGMPRVRTVVFVAQPRGFHQEKLILTGDTAARRLDIRLQRKFTA